MVLEDNDLEKADNSECVFNKFVDTNREESKLDL